jgi:hypothetical protein
LAAVSPTSIRLKIPKSEIVGTIDNAKAKAWLQTNLVSLNYQLQTPLVTYYPPQTLLVGANYTLMQEPFSQEI